MKNPSRLVVALAVSFLGICPAQEAQPEFELKNVEVIEATLPNSEKPWLKIVANYSTTKEWTDSLSFNFYAIVQPSDGQSAQKARMLTGATAYVNIPAGNHQAIVYMTPGALERFGKPIAVSVDCFDGDEKRGSARSGGNIGELAQGNIRRYDGFLRGMQSTPWIVIDSGKTPDLFVPY